MSDEDVWRWEYDPDAEHVVRGLAPHVVAEVERLAGELVTLADVGEGARRGVPGGVRRIPLLADGWFYALPLPRARLVAVLRVVPPFAEM
ncbi:hypothetical protein [Streptomyces griseocarneus]|uniref:hypothetical protein n=1 Tax=Streptomyces griseocarneus TaxID=51201 RepID=UPI00167CE4B3|nr:hypothetical protein [Streptomyces griseocarneus]MBZ6476617.1 hypothetical protein [Streptomyces griseocarneus]GHG79412.1 hypothetical protein GCM10018779_60100 [Streptomyces griseocarneus]